MSRKKTELNDPETAMKSVVNVLGNLELDNTEGLEFDSETIKEYIDLHSTYLVSTLGYSFDDLEEVQAILNDHINNPDDISIHTIPKLKEFAEVVGGKMAAASEAISFSDTESSDTEHIEEVDSSSEKENIRVHQWRNPKSIKNKVADDFHAKADHYEEMGDKASEIVKHHKKTGSSEANIKRATRQKNKYYKQARIFREMADNKTEKIKEQSSHSKQSPMK